MVGFNDGLALVMALISLVTLAVAIYAFVVSLTYSAQAYEAAGKWTKQGWTIVLGLGVLLTLLGIRLPLLSLVFLIAALVFLADVRPALAGLRRR